MKSSFEGRRRESRVFPELPADMSPTTSLVVLPHLEPPRQPCEAIVHASRHQPCTLDRM